MALPSSGQIHFGALADNRDSASRADLSLSALSQQFASGSLVGDVDGNGSANQTADRNALNTAGFAISEFYDAEFVNEFYDTVVAQLADGTAVTDDGYVDGESGRISFDVNDATLGNSYTVGLKNATTNAVIVDETATKTGTGTKTINFTAPSIDAENNFYYPFVSTGTYENAVGSNIDHYDAIGAVSITDPSDTTVANTSATHDITHARSIADESSINDYNWTFAKSSGDGSNPNPTSATTSTPTVRYTGPGIYTADLRVDGLPSQARNSTTAAQVSHRIDYTKAITINNPSSLNEASTITATVAHQGFSSGIDVDLIQASDNSVLLSNDHTTDSRIVAVSNQNQTFTAPARTDSTLSVKVKGFDGGTSATSNAFNIYPLISQQFASGDLSFGASAVTVGQNVTLDVANDVTDNIVGYAWSNQGTGNMTVASGNGSAGDTDGSANDSVSIIDLTDQSHPTVNFDTAQENKTIRLTLYGRLNQTATAEKTINIELVDAVAINSISNINGGSSVTVAGTQAGLQYGAYFGLVSAGATTTFLSGKVGNDSTDSRFSQDSYSGTISPANQNTTATYQGRVVDRLSNGNPGSTTTANTSTFTVFPLLTTSKNTINPTSQTIYSQTSNPNTSTYPTSFTFGTPGTRTDNITARTYSEAADSSNAISLTGDTTPSSQTGTQPGVQASTSKGGATVSYTVTATVAAGDSASDQSTVTNCTVTVNYAPNIYTTAASIAGLATINDNINFSWSWQGVAISSERYELINTDDGNQDGNDLDVTDVTGGGTQSRTSSGNQAKTVANFGVSNGGTYKIKITLFSDSGHTNAVLTAFTPEFEAFAVTEFTSTIKGVGLEGAFFGYVSRLLAAENNSSSNGLHNRIISQDISGGKLYALNVNAGSLVATNNNLSTAFNPLAAGVSGATFLHRDGSVLNIGSDGVIDDVTDATPATPAINASTVSTATDDIEIRVAVNALVTRAFTVSVTPSGGSEATNSVNASNQGASLSQDISLKTIGFSLAAGTAHVIKIRGTNEAEDGNYSSTRTFSTDSAGTAWTTTPSDYGNVDASDGISPAVSSDAQWVLANGSGNTTVTFVKVSGDTGDTVQFAAGTSSSPTNWTSTGSTITISHTTGNFFVRVRHNYREVFIGNSGTYRVTVTNNSVSDTCDATLRVTGA